ncbi:8-oxo-dGTP diphosphatase MutT [Ignavibacteria bacterium]|nr:(deoxy)nucleoside triphosphate pyrophosphohydrolase [Bacteroidota bacterium]MCZ2131743.1 (deoxy)nucleoside triphosphate pyrophosphohydrolase [Bacteroidota bacterium]
MTNPSGLSIRVAVGVLERNGEILLCRRSKSARYALKWEFPGGKVETGETSEEAVRRELREELGIEARIGNSLWNEETTYPDGGVFSVSFYHVCEWSGEIVNRVFDRVEWTYPQSLAERYDILQGNAKFCRELPVLLRNNYVAG